MTYVIHQRSAGYGEYETGPEYSKGIVYGFAVAGVFAVCFWALAAAIHTQRGSP